jgi:hypothetical protein
MSDNSHNIVNPQCPRKFTRNDQIMLGLHLVLVTLYGRFTISIKQKINRIGDTQHNMQCIGQDLGQNLSRS